MSDLAAPEVDPPVEPRRGHRRELLVAGLCVALLVVAGLAVAGVFSSSAPLPVPRPKPTAQARIDPSVARQAARARAVKAVMRERGQAIVRHDRHEFMRTVDPGSRNFRRQQARWFANLRRVNFVRWFYTLPGTGRRAPARARRRYHAPTWAPYGVRLHYRIRGFDPHPTDLAQFPTFVRRGDRWYVASFSDFKASRQVAATGLWDFEPVHVIHRRHVLVLGPAQALGTMALVADEMKAALPKVTAVWGKDWARRVVVLVPPTQQQMAQLTNDRQDLDRIAALTSSEFTTVDGKRSPVGNRVTLNPTTWSQLGSIGSQVVLTHELTHVASRADTTFSTPKWLSEGLAEYVAFLDTGVPVSLAAAELGAQVRVGHVPARLPANRDFRGANPDLAQAYEGAWLACRYLADRYGQHKLVRFYRAVGRADSGPAAAVRVALRRTFHLTPHRFTALWRGSLRIQLA